MVGTVRFMTFKFPCMPASAMPALMSTVITWSTSKFGEPFPSAGVPGAAGGVEVVVVFIFLFGVFAFFRVRVVAVRVVGGRGRLRFGRFFAPFSFIFWVLGFRFVNFFEVAMIIVWIFDFVVGIRIGWA